MTQEGIYWTFPGKGEKKHDFHIDYQSCPHSHAPAKDRSHEISGVHGYDKLCANGLRA
jgi:hypothetical protein